MLLDSNIIIYALTDGSEKQEGAQSFILQNKERLRVAHQNINESIRLLTHPKTPKKINPLKAIRIVTQITNQLQIIAPKQETLQISLALIKKHNIWSNQIFDAYLVATMLSNGINEIVTDNSKDFTIYKGIKVTNPFKEDSEGN